MFKYAPFVVSTSLVLAGYAGPAAGALDTDLRKCQSTAAKQGRVFLKKTFKALAKCEDSINKGKLPPGTDCSLEADTVVKLDKAEDKYREKVEDKCPYGIVSGLDFGGLCLGVTTGTAAADCLVEEHRAAAQTLIETVFVDDPGRLCDGGANDGNPCADAGDCPDGLCVLGKDERKCAKTLGNVVIKHANKRLVLLQKCKKDIATGNLAEGTNCVAEMLADLDELEDKSIAKITEKCPEAVVTNVAFGGGCVLAATDAAVAACALCTDDREVDDLILVQHGTGATTSGTLALVEIADIGDCVGGALSRCRVGDYLLSNSQIRVVVQDIQRNFLGGIGSFGGQIIDADLVRGGGDPDRDNFEEWAVSLNIESTAHYTDLTIMNDGSNGSAAVLRATGVDDLLDVLNPSSVIAGFGLQFPASADDVDIPVTVLTDYILEPDVNYVRVETTVQNMGGTQLDIFFGEFINGGGQVELFLPGYGFGEPMVTSPCAGPACDAVANLVAFSGEDDADGVSYGYVHNVEGSSIFNDSGVVVPQLGADILRALLGTVTANHSLAPQGDPGDSLTFSRLFVVGDGTVSSITDARNEAQCLPTGTLQGTITAGGAPANRADVVVLGNVADGPGGSNVIHPFLAKNVVTHTRTDAAGAYSLTLPPGDYNVIANLDGSPYEGGGADPVSHPVAIAAFSSTVENIALPSTGGLRVTAVDEGASPIAAKVSVVGFDPSDDPFNKQTIAFGVVKNKTGVFGERLEDGFPFGVAFATFVDASGDTGVIPLEPETYQVVVSHGLEYSIDTFYPVVITAGVTTQLDATVERVIDSRGFISGDFHVHSIDSPDAEVSRAERVISMLGEGVDFFAATDHDYRADFQGTISALGVSGLISTAVGHEITTFDYGHFNAWPLDFDPNLPNGGFVDHGGWAPDGQDYPSAGYYSEPPAQIIADAHAAYSGVNTVQVNHFYSHFGIDGGSGLAIDTGLEPPASGDSSILGPARRLDPTIPNYFSDEFDALEVWIGDSRGQIFTNFLGQNAGDWFNLMNQGIVRSAVADTDTHKRFITQSGFPRNMVASLVDAPGSLDPDTVSAMVNDGRVVGTNAPMVRVTAYASSEGESGGLDLGRCVGVGTCTNTSNCEPCTDDLDCPGGKTCEVLPTLISTTDGAVDITVDIQSPVWAEFDTVEYYINSTTTRTTKTNVETGAGKINVNRYSITPDYVQTKNVDFFVNTVAVPSTSSSRLEARTTLSLTGLTDDIWVVVMVKGTDGTSHPLFPVVPNSLSQDSNEVGDLGDLIDGNLGEDGITALAFTNPIFIDVGDNGWTAPGVQINP